MILCVGTTPTVQRTIVLDRLELDGVNRAVEVKEYASGKSVNVARVLRTLGEEVMAVGFAGGRRGQFLLEDIALDRIPFDFLAQQAQTRLCVTVVDRSSGQATELVEEAPPATKEEWAAMEQRIERHAERAAVIVYSGTLAGGAPEDFCARWIGAGRTVVVDARGEPLKRALAAAGRGRVIAKLNREELAGTLGKSLSNEGDLVAAVRAAAPKNGGLIVTLGKGGAVACVDGKVWRVRSPEVKAVSAVGSGDAFTAGLVAGMGRGIEEGLRLGAACGAANALTAHSGHLRVEDVERLKSGARVEAM
jgi:tagatose 6-phosphate kinase